MDQSRIQKILSSKRVLQVLFFIAAVALVTYFFPGEGKFRYTFQEGMTLTWQQFFSPDGKKLCFQSGAYSDGKRLNLVMVDLTRLPFFREYDK